VVYQKKKANFNDVVHTCNLNISYVIYQNLNRCREIARCSSLYGNYAWTIHSL